MGNRKYIIITYPAELTRTKKRSYLDDFLEKQLERFRETAEKNLNLKKLAEVNSSDLINYFLGWASQVEHAERPICELLYTVLTENPACYTIRGEDKFEWDTPGKLEAKLNSINFICRWRLRQLLELSGFDRGFSKPVQKFITKVYEIIYNIYLKEMVEKEKEEKHDPFYQFVKAGGVVKGPE